MTPGQKARLIGWNASLTQRGVLLKLQPAGPSYMALVNEVAPEGGEYMFGKATRMETTVGILRDALGEQVVSIGDSFVNEASGATYRITEIKNHPDDIAVRYVCEAALP